MLLFFQPKLICKLPGISKTFLLWICSKILYQHPKDGDISWNFTLEISSTSCQIMVPTSSTSWKVFSQFSVGHISWTLLHSMLKSQLLHQWSYLIRNIRRPWDLVVIFCSSHRFLTIAWWELWRRSFTKNGICA